MPRQNDPRLDYVAIATRQFARAGYHGASLSDLAKEAGVTKQAFLHFFATKERLYAAVLAELAARLCEDIERAHRPDPKDHLRTYLTMMLQSALNDPSDVRLVVRALLDSDDAARRWPMRPYLDSLVALTRTAGGKGV